MYAPTFQHTKFIKQSGKSVTKRIKYYQNSRFMTTTLIVLLCKWNILRMSSLLKAPQAKFFKGDLKFLSFQIFCKNQDHRYCTR